MTQRYRAPAIQRAVHLVEYIAKCSKHLRLNELADRLQLSKSTLHGILYTLFDLNWLNKDDHGGYYLDDHFFHIFQEACGKWDILKVARPFMLEMRKKVDESVFLGVRDGDYARIKECMDGSKEMSIRARPGARIPLLAGAVGKLFLAEMPEDELEALFIHQKLPQYTKNTILDIETMKKELEAVRRNKIAIDNEEYLRGVKAVASPIFCDRSLIAALWVPGFSSQMTPEVMKEVQRELTYASNIISKLLSTKLYSLDS